jgi:hypothetical protein
MTCQVRNVVTESGKEKLNTIDWSKIALFHSAKAQIQTGCERFV